MTKTALVAGSLSLVGSVCFRKGGGKGRKEKEGISTESTTEMHSAAAKHAQQHCSSPSGLSIQSL